MTNPKQANLLALVVRRDTGPFLWAIMTAIGAYVCILLSWTASRFTALAPLTTYTQVLTAICCAGMVAHVMTMLSAIQSNDEFMRGLVTKRITIAGFATIVFATIWGLLTNVGWAPPFPLLFLYAVFMLVHTALIPFINADRP